MFAVLLSLHSLGENGFELVGLIRYNFITFVCNLFICCIWSQRVSAPRLLLVQHRHAIKPWGVCGSGAAHRSKPGELPQQLVHGRVGTAAPVPCSAAGSE